ncbi:MAG: hypothetical protein WCI74_16380 [Actinomycetes bacterium]
MAGVSGGGPVEYPGAPAAPVVSDELSDEDLGVVSGGAVSY